MGVLKKKRIHVYSKKLITPTPTLAAIIGKAARPKKDIVADVWEYIKENKLQQRSNPTLVTTDEKLKRLSGDQDCISMYDLSTLISEVLEKEKTEK